MPQRGNILHEEKLKETLNKMEKDGWKTIDLKGKSPDGIAVKDNKIIAVEILGATYRSGKGWHKNWSYKGKKEQYSMFDDVVIVVFHRPKDIEKRKELNKKVVL